MHIYTAFSCLIRRGEPNAISIPVKHCVVFPNEYISQDPERSSRRWDIHGHEARQTDCYTQLRLLQ